MHPDSPFERPGSERPQVPMEPPPGRFDPGVDDAACARRGNADVQATPRTDPAHTPGAGCEAASKISGRPGLPRVRRSTDPVQPCPVLLLPPVLAVRSSLASTRDR